MKLYFEEGHQVTEEMRNAMERAAARCLELEGIDRDRCEISVTFVSGEEIRKLNRQYRGIDRVTDVLSFPQFEDFGDLPEEAELCLGDVVICKERAQEQAEEFGHSFQRELLYLFTHSVLHLVGYDHMEESDKREMREREEEVMTYLGIERERR